MKKRISILAFFIVVFHVSFSQGYKLSINYKVQHIVDTISQNQINYDAVLSIEDNKSYFTSLNKLYNDSVTDAFNKSVNDYVVNGAIPEIPFKHLSSQESYEIYKDYNQNLIKEIRGIPAGDKYLLDDSLNNINWTILPEKKQILSHDCQKSETFYKGRLWLAWFCKDFAVPNGPWKLGNLPGIILEAYDENRKISFLAYEIRNESVCKTDFFPPKKITKVTKKEFYKLLSSYADDPVGYGERLYDYHISDTNFSIPIENRKRKLKIPNNPLEPYY